MSKAKITVILLLFITTLALSFGAGYNVALRNEYHSAASQGPDAVVQAWNLIFANYVERERLNASKLSQAAIKGMVAELGDPHTSYFSPEDYQLGLGALEGKFGGIGAQVAIRDKQLVIIAPIPGSPAAKAGIKPGDTLLKINDRSTAEMSLAEAVLTIRGTKGTSVKLVIRHQGETEPVEMEIIRAEIELPSVRLEMKGDIVYLVIGHFSSRTDAELSTVLAQINPQAATGIILDLRSNPGGMLEAVVDVASYFLREGIVVNVRDNRGQFTGHSVKPGKTVTDLPMIVLVDNYSASGSEVLSGALQDYSRAIIAGTRTFGKGSVNLMYRLKDGSGLSLTTARWLTPNGRLIEGSGLEPNIELKLSGEDAINWAIEELHRR